MELGIIRHINIDTEMQASYLDYAMSVIVARALPDVRDGLKPVHRRILYAMYDLGLSNDKPYKKSARIVGEVLGKYHPHGDAPVYEAMVRMAQDFSLRYPLVDGQGNFGSIDGDNAAAMRYTEARLAAITAEMLTDIHRDTVDWTDNFDGTLREPAVLPAALPNLLVNGGSGIAVGMSTSIPPHNLGEICDALCYLIDNFARVEEVTIEDLLPFIPGPDFPTGGVVYRYGHEGTGDQVERVDMIAKAYAGGRGRIVVQAKAHIEEMSRSRSRIVVTELPYQANKAALIERIAELVRDGRLEGITDLRDESDRTGMRLCIEMTRTVEPRAVLGQLFKLTPLESTFGVSLLALVDGEPRVLSLKRILQHFVEYRQDVIVRRSKYDLEQARRRAHILEGLLRALDVLDEVIALIRRSRTADTAKGNLIEQFKFTELQAQAILDMQLRRLAALERRHLADEYRDTMALIRGLEALLASPERVLALIRQDLLDLKTRYGDPRRTQIADRVKGTLTAMDVLPDQDVWITLAADGTLRRRVREPITVSALSKTLAEDASLALLPAHTRRDLYLFSARGQATRVAVHQIPEATGVHFADVSGLTRRDRIVALCAMSKSQVEAEGLQRADEPTPGYLFLGTVRGKVKRVALADLTAQAHTNPQVIALDPGDEVVWAFLDRSGGGELLIATASGQAIRFSTDEVRAMGLAAGGVGGIKLQARDRVVAGQGISSPLDPGTSLAIVSTTGYGKQVPLAEFPVQGRNGQGVVAAKFAGRAGEVAGAVLVQPDESVVCLLDGAPSRVLPTRALPQMSRSAQGKVLFPLTSKDRIWHLYAVATTGDSPARHAPGPRGHPAGRPPETPSATADGVGGSPARQSPLSEDLPAGRAPETSVLASDGRGGSEPPKPRPVTEMERKGKGRAKATASAPPPAKAVRSSRSTPPAGSKVTKPGVVESPSSGPAARRERAGTKRESASSPKRSPGVTTGTGSPAGRAPGPRGHPAGRPPETPSATADGVGGRPKAPAGPAVRKTYAKTELPKLPESQPVKPEPSASGLAHTSAPPAVPADSVGTQKAPPAKPAPGSSGKRTKP